MPSDLMMKAMNTLHRVMLKVSGLRLGWTAGRMPALRLTTTGRRSGEPRSLMLTSQHQIGDTMVIVASKGGDDRNPEWFLNLREHPTVEVETRGAIRTMTAREATAEERAELWPIITADYANYAGYQRKTDREIPLVLLEPLGD